MTALDAGMAQVNELDRRLLDLSRKFSFNIGYWFHNHRSMLDPAQPVPAWLKLDLPEEERDSS